MKLSIVVPCYNVKGYVEKCLTSLVHQDLNTTDYEILVIDDGSTDGTGAICDQFAEKYHQVKVVHQKNAGLSAARNSGLDIAQGDYVFLVDGDDFVAENCFKDLVSVAKSHDLDFLGFSTAEINDSNNISPTPECGETEIHVQTGAEYLSNNSMRGPVWWYITKRELLECERLQFPVGHMLEDAPFTPDVILSANRMAVINKVCYFYVKRPSSIMHNQNREHYLKLLNDFVFAYDSVDGVIKKHREKLDDSALLHLQSRRDSFLYFGIFRAMNAGVLKEFYSILKQRGIIPLRKLDKRDFPGFKWNILRLLFNCPTLSCWVSKMQNVLR